MSLRFEWKLLIALIREAWPVWAGIIGIISPFLMSVVFPLEPARAVLYAGTALQLIGIGLVAIGLAKTRKLFNSPSLANRTRDWFKRLKLVMVRPEPIVVKVGGAIAVAATGSARLVVSLAPGAPLHRRITQLEKDVAELRSNLGEAEAVLRQRIDDVCDNANSGLTSAKEQIDSTKKQLEEIAVGGLHIEWVGLVWLFVGTLYTNIPDEVAAIWAYVR